MDEQFYILHMEDQPDQVSFIPRSIYLEWTRIAKTKADLRCVLEESTGEEEFRICLLAPSVRIELNYLIATDENQFMQFVEKHGTNAIVLVDCQIGDDENAGLRVIDNIGSRVRSYFLMTAYPENACKTLGWSMDDLRLLTKKAMTRPRVINAVLGAAKVHWHEIENIVPWIPRG